jgi:hypothetical protein
MERVLPVAHIVGYLVGGPFFAFLSFLLGKFSVDGSPCKRQQILLVYVRFSREIPHLLLIRHSDKPANEKGREIF